MFLQHMLLSIWAEYCGRDMLMQNSTQVLFQENFDFLLINHDSMFTVFERSRKYLQIPAASSTTNTEGQSRIGVLVILHWTFKTVPKVRFSNSDMSKV